MTRRCEPARRRRSVDRVDLQLGQQCVGHGLEAIGRGLIVVGLPFYDDPPSVGASPDLADAFTSDQIFDPEPMGLRRRRTDSGQARREGEHQGQLSHHHDFVSCSEMKRPSTFALAAS